MRIKDKKRKEGVIKLLEKQRDYIKNVVNTKN